MRESVEAKTLLSVLDEHGIELKHCREIIFKYDSNAALERFILFNQVAAANGIKLGDIPEGRIYVDPNRIYDGSEGTLYAPRPCIEIYNGDTIAKIEELVDTHVALLKPATRTASGEDLVDSDGRIVDAITEHKREIAKLVPEFIRSQGSQTIMGDIIEYIWMPKLRTVQEFMKHRATYGSSLVKANYLPNIGDEYSIDTGSDAREWNVLNKIGPFAEGVLYVHQRGYSNIEEYQESFTYYLLPHTW